MQKPVKSEWSQICCRRLERQIDNIYYKASYISDGLWLEIRGFPEVQLCHQKDLRNHNS